MSERPEVPVESAAPGRRIDGLPASLGVGCGFLTLMVAWMFVVGVVVAVVMLAPALASGTPPDTSAPLSLTMTSLATWLQFAGWAAIAVLLALALRIPLTEAFALRKPNPAAVVAAAVGSLVVGFFPSYIAQLLTEWLPPFLQLGTLDLIEDGLLHGGWGSRLLLFSAVVIAAPLFEELIFRGFLWDTFSRSLPQWAVWLLTSLLFAAIHGDPVQATAVFWTGLFIGWLRWRSGSIWPAILAHFVNNSLAVIATALGADGQDETPLLLAVGGILGTLSFAALANLGARPFAVQRATAPLEVEN